MALLDFSTVQRFVDDLNDRIRRCDNGEGMLCATLDETINQYVMFCGELRAAINQWARAIFTGQMAFDSAAETSLKQEVRCLLRGAKQVAARGRAMDEECLVFQGLNPLHRYLADLDYLLENWVSPQLAVSPAPRVKLSSTLERQVVARLQQLPPLPSDWRPTDPLQRAVFESRKAK